MPLILIKHNKPIDITLITSTNPNTVTKEFSLGSDGSLNKTTTAHVTAGTMETVKVKDLSSFSKLLLTLQVNQCLAYGVTGFDKVELMTEKAWTLAGCPITALPRTSKHMSWSQDGGILMLDYDAPKDGTKSLTREELIESLRAACPWLKDIAMLWWPSTSSCIFNGDKELSGIRGQRIYIIVKNATDIPRIGDIINTLLWSKRIGKFEVSKSGSLLERSLFDGSVWQTNRIDFAAGAKCHDSLEQKRGAPVLIPGKTGVLDSLVAVPEPSSAVIAEAEVHKSLAKALKLEEAAKVRQTWVESRIEELIINTPGMPKELAESTVLRAVESRVLMGDWKVMVVCEVDVQSFSVLHILDNPNEFHGLETLDPLEPDYDGRRRVGKLFLFGARPCLHSMAHGGATYRMLRQPTRIEIIKGNIKENTDMALDALRRDPDVFDFGVNIVRLAGNGKLQVLDGNSLSYFLSGFAQFFSRKPIQDRDSIEQLIDPPVKVCSNILSLPEIRRLKKLVAVITAPCLRPDGTVLSSLGYDVTTGLLFDAVDTPPVIPNKPTKEQAKAALERVWKPFTDFPFVTSLDRAVFLAAILTSVVRAALPTAPGFGLDAPIQSSGKTLLGRCLGVLATGNEPGVFPHTVSGSDEETRKRIFSVLRNGDRVLFLDNILGAFDSAAMAALLTSETYSDRVLGCSEVASVPNRTLVLFTGNNLTFSGDMCRRVLVCRIDPQTDRPYARSFDLNPVAYCKEHRQQMVADALTLIRFYLSSGVPPIGVGKMGSFEEWDGLVRQTILYVDRELDPGKFGDVMERIIASQAVDPEQEMLGVFLQTWHNKYGGDWQFASDVINDYYKVTDINKSSTSPVQSALADAINDLYTGRKELTAKSLGKILSSRKDRIVGGLRLERLNKTNKEAASWRVIVFPVSEKSN